MLHRLIGEIGIADSSQVAPGRWSSESVARNGPGTPTLPISSLLQQLLDSSVEEIARLARVLRDSPYVAVLRGVEGTIVPITTRGRESFPPESVGNSTVSAPLHSAAGEPIATIEVLGPAADVSHGTRNLLRAIVESAARASTERCFRLQHLRDWIVAATSYRDRHACVLLAVDADQRVTGANPDAQCMVQAGHRRGASHHLLSDLFQVGPAFVRGPRHREVPTRVLSAIDSQPWSILVTPPTVVPSSSFFVEWVQLHTRPRVEMLISHDRAYSPSDAASRVIRVDMGASLDRRDHRNPDVRNILQSLAAFIVNSAPDTRVGNISERRPFYVPNEIPARSCNDDNVVRPVLSDPVKGIDKLRVCSCIHDKRATVAMELRNQHAFIIT
jgi:hypothetical protein